ncbi:adenosylcobalamin-dependent ribonucleoside-diphosphate reductase [Tepidamorphus sp. 3E244]|uniref:adenosylcobalamin-dependent ribonucleoside-diphosphate reductase n=1 Tax=Tepidamorphus sp. 3E244 TaxID=3385498 RepID=UPI0038FC679E
MDAKTDPTDGKRSGGAGDEPMLAGIALPQIAADIWDLKYRLKKPDGTPVDATRAETFARVAHAATGAEAEGDRAAHARAFEDIMADGRFLPAGRILAGAGANRDVTLFNCFVMGTLDDSLTGIFDSVRDSALTMQQGGGIGVDFSPLRPKGAPVASIGADASGPVSFMAVWDAMCRTIMSAGARRGAMMATLRCDHPDIEDFIAAKRTAGAMTNFNLSVLVTDAFMNAVDKDGPWDLVFGGRVWRRVNARDLWRRILRATYDHAEPGVVFIDRINAANNLAYCETISATNPCGEQPLPPFGACLLGSMNLAAFVRDPFTAEARLDTDLLDETVPPAVRLMDNVIDISNYPLEAQHAEAIAKRRIGLGVTGLADALVMCGLRYGSPEAAEVAGNWMKQIQRTAWLASTELAAEKGAFPLFEAEPYAHNAMAQRLGTDVQEAVQANGLRNALLTSIAPTGTISLFAGNVSSGVEPIFAAGYDRKVLQRDGTHRTERVRDFAVELYREVSGDEDGLPDNFVTAQDLSPDDHIAMQAALQPFVDSAISKTINVPEDMSFEDFGDVYLNAWKAGLKGCTTYRPNPVTGSVLSVDAPAASPVPDNGGSHEPMARGATLPGYTYKIRWPESEHAIYITINDTLEGGARRPFEIFINSKAMEHFAWTVALTRMISAVFRRGGDVRFVVEELKAVFDPRGGQWMNGHYVPSLLAAIGNVIEQHMRETGFLEAGEPAGITEAPSGTLCPRCSQPTLMHAEGCHFCTNCDYSRCG